jgi:NADP-dependent 3-hydroxy acid dehydrogenase YdfG
MPDAPSLAGRVAVVTGASSGIGAAVAHALAAAGASVVLGARRRARLEAVADSIRRAGGTADAVPTDLCDEAQVERLIGVAAQRGRLDVLVNNAAVGFVRTVVEGRTAEWRATLDTNVLGPLFACRAALPHMLARGAGDIVNVTSASAHESWPYLAAYAASKAAVHALSGCLRAEVAGQGIRVMTVEVHNVATEFGSSFDPAILPEAIARWTALGLLNPGAGLLAPADVARAIVFQLAQPDPASIHHLSIRSRSN